MQRIACKDAAEASCVIANLLAELEQPCGKCGTDGVVLTGTSPEGGAVTVRLMEENVPQGTLSAAGGGIHLVLEVSGGDDLLERIRERRCPNGR